MRLFFVFAVCCLARLAPGQQQGCWEAGGSEIRGRDLAAALPALNSLPPDVFVGNMPLPGSKRIFHSSELASLAMRYSIPPAALEEVCFAWHMQPLARDAAVAAMRASLPVPDARIELMETSAYAVPRGTLEFPLSALSKPASTVQTGPVLWRGDILYGGGLRFAVWARVRIAVACNQVTAVENLNPGVPIQPRQLRIQPAECFPDSDPSAMDPGQLVGLVPRRPISAGSPVRASLVAPPNDVNRGDLIEVEVESGAARLVLTARAETGGRSGDVILVQNPSSHRTFQARISGREHAVVRADSQEVQ
jgi:flagella basal body P-ring formation protein FlgA